MSRRGTASKANGMATGRTAPAEPRFYSRRLVLALEGAAWMHAAQRRKGTTIPYLSHLLGTCAIALQHGANEDEAIAALLHDTIEDVLPADEARAAVRSFGEEVLRIVDGCTADEREEPVWRARKERYIAHLADADRSILLVSASDKLYNARAILADLHAFGGEVWIRFSGGRDGVLWYYRALVEAFRANPAHVPALIGELDRTVIEIERLAR